MILSNMPVGFGGKTSKIKTNSFCLTVTTAKEGIFKGLSSMIWDGFFPAARACAKLIYSDSFGTAERQQAHDLITEMINSQGEDGASLEESVQNVIDLLKQRGILKEAINVT